MILFLIVKDPENGPDDPPGGSSSRSELKNYPDALIASSKRGEGAGRVTKEGGCDVREGSKTEREGKREMPREIGRRVAERSSWAIPRSHLLFESCSFLSASL